MFSVRVLMFILLLFITTNGKRVRHNDICSSNDIKRIYLEFGETGLLSTRNVSYVHHNYDKIEHNNLNKYDDCQLELITCSACVLLINFVYLNISQNCNRNINNSICSCDYIWIYDSFFEEESGKRFCGTYFGYNNSRITYKSKSRNVAFTFFYKATYQHAFSLEYTSERNRNTIRGSPVDFLSPNNKNETYFISTPYFPHPYVRDLATEYVINCIDHLNNCRVRLLFIDFLIAKTSVVELFDSNGKIMDLETGLSFRPSPILSSGPSLTVRFFANGAIGEGFNAEVLFVHISDIQKNTVKPRMDCGGVVDNLGGGVTMLNVVKGSPEYFDCIWILRPSRNYFHFYTHFRLSVVVFSSFADYAELSIHEGLTSFGKRAEILEYPHLNFVSTRKKEHIVPLSEGFYLRFKGMFKCESKLAISYTALNHNDCMHESDFLCQNHRCIPIYLQCDGFDHCGDGSDEPSSCFQDVEHRRWSHTSKFFFQKTDAFSELPLAAMIFIICCFGLISLLLVLIILIFRVSGRARHQREMENNMQVIRELFEHETPIVEEEIIIEDDPPVYENPPNYEDINKYKTQFSERVCRKFVAKDSRRRSRASFKSNAQDNTETSGINAIPDSPPPAYFDSDYGSTRILTESSSSAVPSTSEGGTSEAVSKINSETIQSFFLKRFANDDFVLLKKKLLQKSRKRNKSSSKTNNLRKSLSSTNHCLSDGDISEMKTDENAVSDPISIQRSFSFDDL